ncbi:MAG: gephyrin-like molybdotransferase Glp [Paracoccaceae bacterium]
MISVDDALTQIFKLIRPVPSETIRLEDADGRVLSIPAVAKRDQPPFAASAMDGYAICKQDASTGAKLKIIGQSAAGHGFSGQVAPGQCVRIFTGAPLPNGADLVVIQEDVARQGETIALQGLPEKSGHVRPAGGDFCAGEQLVAPRLLGPSDLSLLASMNVATLTVARRPVVALIATGDELVMSGETPNSDQIIASNSFGLAAMARRVGAQPRILPIARDNATSLEYAFSLAKGADLVVTIGGASVGDHDIVADVVKSIGIKPAFHKIAMRPGKPLMAGKFGNAIHLGLPGNPVSSLVCGHIFMLPALRAMQGLLAEPAPRHGAVLTQDISSNGPREHYMRARVTNGEITVFDKQDSALLGVMSQANALLVRPVDDRARKKGAQVTYVSI